MPAPRWSVSRELTVRWEEGAGLVAEGSLSAPPLSLPPDAVALLDCVWQHPDLEEAVAAFLARYPDDPARPELERQVRELVADLQRAGILVADDPQARPLQDGGVHYTFASPHAHVQMLRDRTRTEAYRRAVERRAPGRTVLDLGCGTGILALFAARAGARHVYAVEETSILEVARELARVNGLDGRITFVAGNSRDVSLPERVDLVVSELIGNEPLGERIVPVLRDASRRFLRPGGTMIPSHLSVTALGVQSRTVDLELSQSLESLRGAEALGDLYGLDVSPLVAAYAQEYERGRAGMTFSEHLRPGGPEGDTVLTAEARVATWDLADLEGVATRWRRTLSLPVVADGVLNAVVTWFSARLDDDVVLSTSPFRDEVPGSWGGQMVSRVEPLEVRAGSTVEVVVTVDSARVRGGIGYRPLAVRPPGRRARSGMRRRPDDRPRGPVAPRPGLPAS